MLKIISKCDYLMFHDAINVSLKRDIKNTFSYFQALDAILKALSLCSTLETICAKYHEEHGDILKDMEDYEAAEEVRILNNF